MTEAFRLTDLTEAAPGRAIRRYATKGTRRLALVEGLTAAREVMTAMPRDLVRGLLAASPKQPRIEVGGRPDAGATRIALYVHYSATGRISEMVRYQLELLAQAGFSIVFISMAEGIPDADWQAVRALVALAVQRPNFGLDFGAWRDLLPEVRRRWSVPHELLLVNDSVLGPIHPLQPVFEAMRAGGDGLFGLTESLQTDPHLQSYMLLARGLAAVDDLMRFVQGLHVSSSKWVLVRMGEVRLSRWMRRRGHRVAALFGYDRLVRATLANPTERKRLQATYRRLWNLEQLSPEAAIAALHRRPLNPTHHLWRVLATQFNCPFLKTELIRRNPARLPGVTDWQSLVPADSPCPIPVIEAHLATLDPINAFCG